jgi:tetratricopeptide (TPR) repeat protein
MAVLGKILALAGVVAGSASLGAQTPAAPACDLAATKGNLVRASLAFEQARGSYNTPNAPTALKNAIKALEATGKDDDPTVRALLLGQTLSFWLAQPNIGLAPKRGAIGFTSNPEATIDLPATLDSAFRVVETAQPNCAKLTSEFRSFAYRDAAGHAINMLNADKLDSAEYFANVASRIYGASPYSTMVLGTVAARRNDNAKAVQHFTTSAELAAKDTAYRDVLRQVLANAGNLHLASTGQTTGAARVEAARRAADAYRRMLAVPEIPPRDLVAGRSRLQSALLIVGDTAAAVASYQPLLANPANYDYQDLLNSAVTAARLSKAADAAKLFEGALSKNPYNRDALFNVAVEYLALDQNAKVRPIVDRLIVVDPGNPENYNNAARAYLALAKAARASKNSALEKTYNDSAAFWYNRGSKLPLEVTFTEFTPGEKQITLSGTVLDRRDKAESETAAPPARSRGKAPAKPAAKGLPPKAVTLNFEALDKSGAVVGSKSVSTEALTPGKSGNFTITIDAPGAMAYRYTIAG